MRLYKTTQTDAGPEPVRIIWDGTQAAAATTRAKCVNLYHAKHANLETETIDVPTDKKGLLEWLNSQGNR